MTPKEIADYIKSQIVTGVQRFSVGSRGTSVPANINITNVIQGGGEDHDKTFKAYGLMDACTIYDDYMGVKPNIVNGVIVNKRSLKDEFFVSAAARYALSSGAVTVKQFMVGFFEDGYRSCAEIPGELLHVEPRKEINWETKEETWEYYKIYYLVRTEVADEVRSIVTFVDKVIAISKINPGGGDTLEASFDPGTCKGNFMMAHPYCRAGMTICYGLVGGNKMGVLAQWNSEDDQTFETFLFVTPEMAEIKEMGVMDRGFCFIHGKAKDTLYPTLYGWMPYIKTAGQGGLVSLSISAQHVSFFPFKGCVIVPDDGTENYVLDLLALVSNPPSLTTQFIDMLFRPNGTKTIVSGSYNMNPFYQLTKSFDQVKYATSCPSKLPDGSWRHVYLLAFNDDPDIFAEAQVYSMLTYKYANGAQTRDSKYLPRFSTGIGTGITPTVPPTHVGPLNFFRDDTGQDYFLETKIDPVEFWKTKTTFLPVCRDRGAIGDIKCGREVDGRVFLVGTKFNDILYRDEEILNT
jgi:hypothetical protein